MSGIKFKWKRSSIFTRLFLVIVALAITQILLFTFLISGSNIVDKLRQSKIQVTENVVETRKNTIENKMTGIWTEINTWDATIDKLEKLHDSGKIKEEGDQVAELVLSLLERSMTTGAYYISLEANENGGYDAFYFKDENPDSYSITCSDVYAEYGRSSVVKDLGVTLDSNWKAYGDQELVENPFIQMPLYFYNHKPDGDEMDYGYWRVAELPYNPGIEAIMFTIPLVDENKDAFGVLGVEITVEYMESLLKFEELTLGDSSAYVLAIHDRNTDMTIPVAVKGHEYRARIKKQKQFKLLESGEWDGIYRAEGMDGNNLFFKRDIRLYRSNTPFVNEQWCLLAIQNGNALFADENGFEDTMFLFKIIAFIVAVGVAFFASAMMANPIRKITAEIRNANPMEQPEIKRVQIYEIDALLDTIEEMAKNIADTASRVSDIIKAAQLPVGVIEIDKDTNDCYVTSTCFTVLELEDIEGDYLFLKMDQFNEMMQTFHEKATLYQGEDESDLEANNIYEIVCKDGRSKWVAFNSKHSGNKLLLVVTDITENILKNIRLEYEVSHDELSKLYNIKAFRKEVEQRLEKGEREMATVAMWDLDNLKYINDTYGHEYGDLYIKEAARCLSSLELEGGIVARRSGDEFYAYVDGDDREKLLALFHRTHEKLMETEITLPDHEKMKIRASGGIAWYPQDAESYGELLKKADFAMYSVKHNNKGVLSEFSEEEYQRDEILISGNEELNRFIDEKLLKMAYQPIVDVRTGVIFAFEALMRPKTERFRSPMDVIRMAKSQARMNDIEVLTWETVLEDYFYNKRRERRGRKLFVNSLPNAILPDCVVEKNQSLYGRFYHEVVTEITEVEEMNEAFMDRKRMYADQVGSQFALDDYGSGFNSELKLIQLHPAFVKIDKAFVEGIIHDAYRQEMVRNTISYCNSHGIQVIAEGVETEEELAYMMAAGVDYVQGYYLARPSEELPNEIEIIAIRDKVLAVLDRQKQERSEGEEDSAEKSQTEDPS